MKIDKGFLISGIAMVLLLLFFFTPVGDWVKGVANEKSLAGPNTEKPVHDFSLNDEELAVSLKGYNRASDANLADFRGDVVFLNFWGSWCQPCVEEMPSIQKLYETHQKNVRFVLIAMMDKPEKFEPFLLENDYTMPVYEASSLIPKVLMPRVYPTTYIINRKGEVVMKEISTKDWNSLEINQLMYQLIGE